MTRLTDILAAIVVVALGAKAIGTVVLLLVGREARYQPGWGSWVWWMTKITPIVAVPCAIAYALLQKQIDAAMIFAALAVFVVIAVPWKIRQRQTRIAARASTP